MAQILSQAEFDALLPKELDFRPTLADQVRNFLASPDYGGAFDSEIAKAEAFLRSVERAGYAKKIRQSDSQSAADATVYETMLKNWKRETPRYRGDKNFARGVLYYLFRNVANHVYFTGVARKIWPADDIVFQRLYYAKYHDDPKAPNFSEVCARYRADARVVRREFRKIWLEAPVGAPSKVHLGPVTIVLDEEDDLNPLSLQEPANADFVTDGMPDVFKALDWRSRLSGFHGREKDARRLTDWALDEERTLKVVLISGPGGAGKTRLAADTVAHLVHDHGWCGGFLGDANRPIDGTGNGVALIIDYPEERTGLVSDILKAASRALKNGESNDRPVRLILVSRETREAWEKILNEPAGFIEEIRLDARPYLEIEDALAIAGDIAIEYPERLGRTACEFSEVENWLKNPVHRLPLNVVAASVHAVLDPGHAFKLDGAGVLNALTEWELRRVRYYSERDLGDRDSLEKLLGLSIFTQSGLSKEVVFELGEKDVCPSRTGAGLLETLRKTPFWQSKSDDHPSHLVRLEPDRPAAIFCLKALSLDDPSPALPEWLAPAASQDSDGFGDRLSRLAFDIGYVDPEASQILEQQCIMMLKRQPELIGQFEKIASRRSPVFSAVFAVEICQRLLDTAPEAASRAALMNNLAALLSDLGQYEDSLAVIDQAVSLVRRSATHSSAKDPDLAQCLNTQACALSDLGKRESAIKAIDEAVSIFRRLASAHPEAFQRVLAVSLSNQATILSKLQRRDAALRAIDEATSICRERAETDPESFLSELAGALYTRANRLSELGQSETALEAIEEAVSIYRQLATARPDAFLPDLATSLNTKANKLSNLERPEAALEAIKEAIPIFRQLAKVLPATFQSALAMSLNNQSTMLSKLQQSEPALEAIEEAVPIFRTLAEARPDAFLTNLAGSLNTQANRLSELGLHEAALEATNEATSIYQQLAQTHPNAFLPDLAGSLNTQANRLSELGRSETALKSINEAVSIYRQLQKAHPDAFLPGLAMSLNTQANRYSDLGQYNAALEAIEEAILVLRQLVNVQSEAFQPKLSASMGTKANILTRLEQWEAALLTATKAIYVLRPFFVSLPMAYLVWMEFFLNLYFKLCERTQTEPDLELLQPILEVFKQIRK